MSTPTFPTDLFPPERPLPPRFQLFGMGHRRKLVFQDGRLRDALNGELLREWKVNAVSFEPSEYRVLFEAETGAVGLKEDEQGVWLEEKGERTSLTQAPVKLPRFADHPRAALLRALHAELLINVMPAGPVPNLWVYPRPWYRDAALMLMAFAATGNLALVEPWVMGLTQTFDYNNRGIAEADNPGQLLYMISLVSDRKHPLVEKILADVKRFEKDRHIAGLSDYQQHPVYQTKWLKYGLRALGLDDPYVTPAAPDSYSSLFWMDYRDQHVPGPRFDANAATLYPYLRWAEAHFHGEPPPLVPDANDFPLSWEGAGSEAFYYRMKIVSPACAEIRFTTPHTWHGAEMFLYFWRNAER